MPEKLNMLGKVKGKTIIDIGCGEGGYPRMLADLGAFVTGIDYSEELISEAKNRNEGYYMQYYVKDACHLDGIGNDLLDFAGSVMCLMTIKDIEVALGEA